MSVHVIYGSDGGTTRALAQRLASRLGGRAIDVAQARVEDFETPSLLVLGSPTYGFGDLQTDWEDRLALIKEANLSGKRVALFGTGDQGMYPDTFVDAMGVLYDAVVGRGAEVVGFTATDGYTHTASTAVRDGRFVGLALDEDQQPKLTEKRLSAWVDQIR
ncbi:flavodoxin FldA [Pararhodospirillum oryzae]|uniref:Flavodoxin n=1 Tax=Pararhodospirillum oryzae TaxID=478448 RepID=A0A512H599_9PROT|nr:flavodoxin FldA [Pararhodospirillum oryzae]GEO80656.1 flavodoxin [Pararhodospirillum oryzae]